MTPHTSIANRRLLTTIAIAAAVALTVATPARAQELGERCTNADVGYTVDFPTGWYVNEDVEGGESEEVAACRFFSPEEFEVQPATQAFGIAVAVGVQQDGPHEAGEPATVGGRPATRIESVLESGGIDPAGTRYYSYWVDLVDGTWLLATTSHGASWVGEFDENTATLDAMMESLTFRAATLPDTAVDDASAPGVSLIAGAGILLVALTLAAIRIRAARSVA